MTKKAERVHIILFFCIFVLSGCWGGFYIDPPLSCAMPNATAMYHPVKLGASSAPAFIWSPNGQHIAYRNSGGEIFVLMNVVEEKDQAQQIFIGTGSGLSWSSDGSKIIFVNRSEDTNAVIIVDTITGESLKLTEEESTLISPIWSTVNEEVVYTKRTGSHSTVLVSADVSSGFLDDMTILAESEFGEGINLYSWSPDGSQILFEKVADGDDINLFTYAIDSNAERLVTELTGCEREGVWSPDNKNVAYSSNHDGNWDIFVAPIEEQAKPNNLTNSKDPQEFYPTWSAIKNQIVFVSYHSYSDTEFSQDLFLIYPDGKNLVRLTNSPEHETYPLWSPSEPYLAYLVFDGTKWSINIANLENNRLVLIYSIRVD